MPPMGPSPVTWVSEDPLSPSACCPSWRLPVSSLPSAAVTTGLVLWFCRAVSTVCFYCRRKLPSPGHPQPLLLPDNPFILLLLSHIFHSSEGDAEKLFRSSPSPPASCPHPGLPQTQARFPPAETPYLIQPISPLVMGFRKSAVKTPLLILLHKKQSDHIH